MNNNPINLIAATLLCAFIPTIASAASISGQGTWETTLQGRDLTGDGVFDAYYDTTLDITWLANANAGAGSSFEIGAPYLDGQMTWANANAWAAALDVNGITGWRLPTNTPINGTNYQTNDTTNATSDVGYADADGWVDVSGNPVSEMGHMFYVTLGNLGACAPDDGDGDPATCYVGFPDGWGLSNTGPFSNVQSSVIFWSGSELNSSSAWLFNFSLGNQDRSGKGDVLSAWAVHDGDVGASVVPVPAAAWLFGSGLLGLLAMARKRRY
jgi:hypothetical protein